jgi:hypothetical protein
VSAPNVPLVIATLTGQFERRLRRFRWTTDEPRYGTKPDRGCDASRVIARFTPPDGEPAPAGDNWPHDDDRWPTACDACGRAFDDADQWQRNEDRIYDRAGVEIVWRDGAFGRNAPPGTMVRCEWYDEFARTFDHPGGVESWIVALPDGGEWITTQRATGGGHWTVTGTPPNLTVTPSIFHNAPHGWHGFITNGELVTC